MVSRHRFYLLPLLILNTLCLIKIGKIIQSDQTRSHIFVDPPLTVQIPFSVYSLSKSIPNHTLSIPTRLKNSNVLVQHVRVNRLRSGGSAIFLLRSDGERLNGDFWCLFGDELITPVYINHLSNSEEEMILLECTLPSSIRHSIWFNRTEDRAIPIYLSTDTEILLQGFLTIPWSIWNEVNEQSLTLCTRSMPISQQYWIDWIDYHLFVGFRKFVIYLDSMPDTSLELLVENYDEDHPGLIDLIPWNSTFVGMSIDCFLHYADLSEWIGMIDMNEYLIPPMPYQTVAKFLKEIYARQARISIPMNIDDFFSGQPQKDSDPLMIQNTFRRASASGRTKIKHLYRARAASLLFADEERFQYHPLEIRTERIMLARYHLQFNDTNQTSPQLDQFIIDTSLRNRFYATFRQGNRSSTN